MTKSKYGYFTGNQLDQYREKLHKKMFWLLLYKDPNTNKDLTEMDFDKYFVTLMKEINGLNDLLLWPDGLIEMLSILEAAYNESKAKEFNFRIYRKFILDAHNLLDKIDWEVKE